MVSDWVGIRWVVLRQSLDDNPILKRLIADYNEMHIQVDWATGVIPSSPDESIIDHIHSEVC